MTQFKPRKLTASEIRKYLPNIPFNAALGMRLAAAHPDGVTVELDVRPDMMNGANVLHGGVTAALADVAAGMATNRQFGGRRTITTVEMKINFFQPVTSGKVQARSHLIRVGNTLTVSRVDVFNGGKKLVGAALVTYMVLGEWPKGSPPRVERTGKAKRSRR